MIRNLYFWFLVVLMANLWPTLGAAQQLPQYSMYMLNPYHYNVGYAGLDESLSATGVFRKQWLGFGDTPLNFNFNAHLPLEYLNSGVGVRMSYDESGFFSNTNVRASYNYILDFKDKGRLSFGVGFLWMQETLDGTNLRGPDGTYEGGRIISHNDDLLPNSRITASAITADAGIYYQHPKFEVGLAATNLTEPTLDANSFLSNLVYNRTYILTGSYRWDINQDISLHPSLLLKTDFIKFQPEIGALFKYQDNFFGGLAFRGYNNLTSDAVVVIAGMQLNKNLMLAYSYDITTSSLRTFQSGSHEVVLNYNLRQKLGKEIPAKVIYNPRFL